MDIFSMYGWADKLAWFRPDITVMVGWALKINYQPIYLPHHKFWEKGISCGRQVPFQCQFVRLASPGFRFRSTRNLASLCILFTVGIYDISLYVLITTSHTLSSFDPTRVIFTRLFFHCRNVLSALELQRSIPGGNSLDLKWNWTELSIVVHPWTVDDCIGSNFESLAWSCPWRPLNGKVSVKTWLTGR